MTDRMLYFECFSGISGDMAVAAMIDLGVDAGKLKEVLDTLPMDGFSVNVSRVSKSGLDCCDFDVVLEDDNHDHDMEYLYGNGDHHGHHGHSHRNLDDVLSIINGSSMSAGAKSTAERIFRILADAEAKAHGVPLDKVHFHEVGAVDSIVDIAALATCIDMLDIDRICFSDLYEGSGTVRCQHGVIPVPVPAVVNIASAHGLRLKMTGSQGELVTPTGAAFAAAVGNCVLPKGFGIVSSGYGAGKRVTDRPGFVRAMILEPDPHRDVIFKLECNIDDCSGETLGHTMERLFAEGARDVFHSPIYMKKNRPAYMLTVLCTEEDVPRMERIVFEETTTIGIRRCPMERTVMDRRTDTVETPLGKVDVKVCTLGDTERSYPEYESLAAVCREKGIPYRDAYDTVMRVLSERRNR